MTSDGTALFILLIYLIIGIVVCCLIVRSKMDQEEQLKVLDLWPFVFFWLWPYLVIEFGDKIVIWRKQ